MLRSVSTWTLSEHCQNYTRRDWLAKCGSLKVGQISDGEQPPAQQAVSPKAVKSHRKPTLHQKGILLSTPHEALWLAYFKKEHATEKGESVHPCAIVTRNVPALQQPLAL